MKVFSLAAVTATIKNPYYGNATFGGEQYIKLGGGGKLVDSIKYAFTNNMFNMSSTADGGAVVAHNASKMASINFNIEQTSPHIIILSEFYKWCWVHPELAESEITVRDDTGNIAFEATGVFPVKFPDNEVGSQSSTRDFGFSAVSLIPQESNVG